MRILEKISILFKFNSSFRMILSLIMFILDDHRYHIHLFLRRLWFERWPGETVFHEQRLNGKFRCFKKISTSFLIYFVVTLQLVVQEFVEKSQKVLKVGDAATEPRSQTARWLPEDWKFTKLNRIICYLLYYSPLKNYSQMNYFNYLF